MVGIYVWQCANHPAFWVFHGRRSQTPRPFLGSFQWTRFGHAASKAHYLIFRCYIFEEAVMSYMMSQCCMCIGHVTFHYKRPANASVRVLACCLSVCQVQLYNQRPACGWCLTCVGHDTSSASPGWSLLPSNVIILLASVNSAVSPVVTQLSQQDLGVPLYSLLVLLPQDCSAFWLVSMCIVLGATLKSACYCCRAHITFSV